MSEGSGVQKAQQRQSAPQLSELEQLKADNAALRANVEQAEARAQTAEARIGALESEGSNRRGYSEKEVRPATGPGKKTWPFAVKCMAKPKPAPGHPAHPDVADAKIDAVDESEAIRQFCLMRKDEHGRQLDPTRYTFQATCLKETERKQLAINRVNNRRLVNRGALLSLDRGEELLPPEQNAKRQGRELAVAS